MTENEWKELAARAAKGDSAAFERLYKESQRSVYYVCLKMLGDEQNANDAVQETYITAFEKLSQLDSGENFTRWVNGIAANKCRAYYRKPVEESLDEHIEQGGELTDESFIPEEYASDAEKRRIIMNIIETELTDVQRRTVLLYYYSQLTVSEIAVAMDCTESSVKYRLVTAREKIKEAVVIYEKEHDDRLHAIVPIPVLTRIFRAEAEQISVPDIPLHLSNAGASSANTVIKNAGGTTHWF